MPKNLGVLAVVLTIVVLLFTGQLLVALIAVVTVATLGYIWCQFSDYIFDNAVSMVRTRLSSIDQYLTALCTKKTSKGTEYSSSELSSLMDIFHTVPEKREIWAKLQNTKDDMKELDKLTAIQHQNDKIGGVCVAIACLMMPGYTIAGILLYLFARWLFMPRIVQSV